MSYKNDRIWSDQFLPEVKQIIGPHLLEPASFEIDAMEATDLIILHAKDMRIGVRVRRNEYFPRYSGQITFRYMRDSGAKTEWDKILRGWGDWFFYGFAGPSDKSPLACWHLVDLDNLRYHHSEYLPFLKHGVKDNKDGTYFKWFDLQHFSAEPCVIIAKGPIQ